MFRPHRGGPRIRSRRDGDPCGQGRGVLCPQRVKDVDHEREHRGRGRGLGQARRRGEGLSRGKGYARFRSQPHQTQDVPSSVHHLGAGLRGLQDPGGELAAQDGRATLSSCLPRQGTLRDRLGRDRRCHGVLRGFCPVCKGAHPVRQADRLLPARSAEAQPHAHRDDHGAALEPSRRPAQGRREGISTLPWQR